MSAEASALRAPLEDVAWSVAVRPLLAAAGMGLLTYFVGGTWCLAFLAFAIGVIGYGLGLLAAVLGWAWHWRDRPPFAWRPLAIGLVLIASSWVFLGAQPLPMHRALSWCRECLPALRVHRARTGRFPLSLAEAGLHPPWLTAEIEYTSDGSSFSFNVVSPGDFTGFSGCSMSSSWPGWIWHD